MKYFFLIFTFINIKDSGQPSLLKTNRHPVKDSPNYNPFHFTLRLMSTLHLFPSVRFCYW